jgi:hypothetical protein
MLGSLNLYVYMVGWGKVLSFFLITTGKKTDVACLEESRGRLWGERKKRYEGVP